MLLQFGPGAMGRCAIVFSLVLTQTPVFQFEAVQPELFGLGGSFTNAWADIDIDGDPDLFVGFGGTPNRLYRNDKGTFTDIAAAAGVADARATRAVAWGDFDADGDPDLLVGFTPGETSLLKLYRNDRGKFLDVPIHSMSTPTSLAIPPCSECLVHRLVGVVQLSVLADHRDADRPRDRGARSPRLSATR